MKFGTLIVKIILRMTFLVQIYLKAIFSTTATRQMYFVSLYCCILYCIVLYFILLYIVLRCCC